MATLDQITSEYILDESGRQGGQLTETNCPNTKAINTSLQMGHIL